MPERGNRSHIYAGKWQPIPVSYAETWQPIHSTHHNHNHKKPGHTRDKCYKLHGFPPNFKFTKGKNACTAAIAHGYPDDTMNKGKEESNTTTGTVNDNTGGAVNFAGATHHMTFNKSLLTNIRHLPYPFLITLPNGYKVKVTEIGDGPSLKSPLEIGRARNGLLTSLSVHPASSCKCSCNPLNFSSDVSTSHAHTNTPIGTCAFYKNEEDFLHPNNLFILTTLHVYCLSNGQTD
ncbi:hypothetical protein KY290_000836 [Solanum tuberosum]|uniref:Uncharacterized protein n=1 Tax=Solanum tuberosum TaxID=4113 RepID=A0ABQ7WKH0_SOLTU|nr:hypothetical protein KY289_000890 [Solanum tuberosum]KAH0781238.1 hypothetical protein KY290_000836 [Solanum tuberosum]